MSTLKTQVTQIVVTPVTTPDIANKVLGMCFERDFMIFTIESTDKSKSYKVKKAKFWSCDCPHHIFRKAACKHITVAKTHYDEYRWLEAMV